MDLLDKFLTEQSAMVKEKMQEVVREVENEARATSTAIVPAGVVGDGAVTQTPGNEVLDEFRAQVRKWIEVDNNIKKLAAVKKEQMALKRELTKKVLEFMAKYNIEDLNTRDGKLRYKVTMTKAPVTRATIRTRLAEMHAKGASVEETLDYVFTSEQTVQRPSLRRLKATPT